MVVRAKIDGPRLGDITPSRAIITFPPSVPLPPHLPPPIVRDKTLG